MHYLTKRIQELKPDEQQKVIDEVLTIETSPKSRLDRLQLTLMANHTDAAYQRFLNFGKMQGISSGYHSIDKLTKGLVGGELIVIAGKTSRGKTTLAINIANQVALGGGRVLFVTLEMTQGEITSRFMYLNGGKDTEKYATVSASILFQNSQELDWQDIDGLIEQAIKELEVNLVVIDHLHYFSREIENTAEDIGRITKEFKKNAITHNIPVMLISHVRKTTNGKEATMDDLRSSSFISQDADIVLMVGRDPRMPDTLATKVEKNRNRGFDPNDATGCLHFDKTKLTEMKQEGYPEWNT